MLLGRYAYTPHVCNPNSGDTADARPQDQLQRRLVAGEAEQPAYRVGSPCEQLLSACGRLQVGTYVPGAPKQLDNFTATPQWEDMWAQRPIDVGKFYASKVRSTPRLPFSLCIHAHGRRITSTPP